ncbi:MAG: hypothetical protein LQ338_001657 [Usnochroma carphineum]|nr:MAG: hypothetical protein LQ338_001657 [Usnochroma carphineum]
MPTFRHCCRHPRASSPGLPNIQLVPSPTQDDGYDADAVRISTPVQAVIEHLRPHSNEPLPSLDEPRPSSDTIVHREVLDRSSMKLADDEAQSGGQARSRSLRVRRVNSIVIPRRRSYTQSQPLPSPSTAALDSYVKISPSRAALRKRLEAVKVVDDAAEIPPSPKLGPARITSIPESALSPRWRLSYNESSSSFRRQELRELSTNEHLEKVAGEGKVELTFHRAPPESAEVQQEAVILGARMSLENERPPDKEAPTGTDAAITRPSRKREQAVSGEYLMPGSHQSESTAASVHLYDMHISERVASSNSNIVALGDLKVRRQRSSTTASHPTVSTGISRYQRSREMSSLKSPKESSSIYSSHEEELASSRRSSMLLIQGLPERIERLKSRATAGDLYATSAQHSQITVIPRSRFPTTVTEEGKQQQEPKKGGMNGKEAEEDERNLYESKSRSPPLRRSSTEPRLNRFKRDGPASFDGSGEWHLSPPSRQPTGRLHRQSTGLISRQPTGLLAPEDAASVWERALREHAQEDNAISRARVGSISYEIGRDDFKRRARSRRFTRTPSPLQEITEDPWSQARGKEKEPASGRVSPTQTVSGRTSPTAQASPAPGVAGHSTARQASSSTRSVDSWTRYPSHTFRERTETANAKDKVITRDFAIGQIPQRKISKKKSRSMTFGRRFLHKVGRLYKTRSSDFRRYNAGHRSSISVGGVLEYPELEIPRPSFEPVLLSGPRGGSETDSTVERETALREAIATPIPSSPQHPPADDPSPSVSIHSPELTFVQWNKRYDDCVMRPRNTSTEDEGIAPDETGPRPHNYSSLELDEKQQAEVDRAKDEALKAADECLRRSMEMVRYPKRI